MPQDSTHPLYDKRLPQWQRCRDAIEGTDAVKIQGELYLPRPSGMTNSEYLAYKIRANWFNAAHRTLSGYVGMVQRKAPIVVAPEPLAPQLSDVTGTGLSFAAFATLALAETFLSGHGGMLLDLQKTPANAIAPQWAFYQAEQILNWQVTRQPNGTMALTQVMLYETIDERAEDDPYKHVSTPQWRELVLVDNVYQVQLWRKGPGLGSAFVLFANFVPTRFNIPLPFIPFDMDLLGASLPPPLLDIVDVNFSHYRTSADYEHDLHMTCMKTPWVIAQYEFTTPLKLGGLQAWHIPVTPNQAAIGMLEPNGASLQAKLDKLQAAEQQMAVLGARLLEPQKRSVETAEALGMRQSGEQSVLQEIAQALSQRLSRVLRWHAWWAGMAETPEDESIRVTLNTDLVPQSLSPQELDALSASYHQGILTQESVYYNLQQGEMLAPDEADDLDLYVARLATQAEAREPQTLGEEQ